MSSIREDLLPLPGEVIAEHYEIEELLGHGGMGAVFAAKHTRTGRAVAIKWMLPQAATSTESVARFIAEARATARIEHPNVVHIYDFGESNGSPFLVMERLRGRSLREHIDEVGRLSPADAIHLLVPAMRGVAEAHREGIIHRDIKPDNIFLCRGKDGSPREAKVVDFGISKLYDADGKANLTGTGMMMGTPAYMSPEQLNAPKEADARFDVYAFGVVFYEAITGRQPYEAEGIFQLVAQIMNAQVVPPSHIASDVPAAMDASVLRAMHRDMPQRYATMADMIQHFEALRPHLGMPGSASQIGMAGSQPGVAYSPTLGPSTGPLGPGQGTPYPPTQMPTPAPGGYVPQPTPAPGRQVHPTAAMQAHITPGSQPGLGSHPGMGSAPGLPPGYGSHPGVSTQPGYAGVPPAGTPHTPYGTPSPVAKKKGSGAKIALLGFVALFLGVGTAGGTAFFLSQRGSNSDPVTAAPPVAQPPAAQPPAAQPPAAQPPAAQPPTAVAPAAEPLVPNSGPTPTSDPAAAAAPSPATPTAVEPTPVEHPELQGSTAANDVDGSDEPTTEATEAREPDPPASTRRSRRSRPRPEPPRPVFRPAPPPQPIVRRPPPVVRRPPPTTRGTTRGANGAMIIE